MKRLIAICFMGILGGLVVISQPIKAQDTKTDKKTEKKVRIKTVKEENGKKVVFDTTFTITGDMDDIHLEKYGIDSDGEDVSVEVTVDSDGNMEKSKNVFIIKDKDGNVEITSDGKKSFSFSNTDGEHPGIIKWIDEDGNEKIIDVNSHMKDFDIDMELVQKELADAQREIHFSQQEFQDKLENIDEIIELKHLKELEKLGQLDELRELQFVGIPDAPDVPDAPGFVFFSDNHGRVSDIELRDAGIKNKPNRLGVENIDIDIKKGMVDLYFKLKNDGNPKVIVYNVYGDKVFSEKPEKMNDQYSIRINLSEKQHGTYYIMIVDGNSSKTEKIRI